MGNTEVTAQAGKKINIVVRDWWTQWGGIKRVQRFYIQVLFKSNEKGGRDGLKQEN